jgi:spermidine synthase
VYRTQSPISGRIRVIDVGGERRLLVGGETLSAFPCDGDWTRMRHEYWWHALEAVKLPARPTALFVGLGGGTQLHLLRERARPRRIAVIERDPVIVRVAWRYFGLHGLPDLEVLCDDAEVVIPALARTRRRFDFVMEDAMYAAPPERAIPLAETLARLVTRRGVLVLNRHRRRHARQTAAALRSFFADVRLRHVRRDAENVLVCASRRHDPRHGGVERSTGEAPPAIDDLPGSPG